jgi:hypothetical protein
VRAAPARARRPRCSGIDRATERDATRAAAGIAPDVIAFDPRHECLVTSFIDGRPVEVPSCAGPLLAEVAGALRSIHRGPRLTYAFSPWQRVARYRATAVRRRMPLPPGFDEVSAAAARISAALGPRPSAPCHNDLLTANFMHDGTRLRILDWEYAGQGDPAVRPRESRRPTTGSRRSDEERLAGGVLRSPARVDPACRAALMRLMAAFWEAMWAVVQQASPSWSSTSGAYAAEHLRPRARTARRSRGSRPGWTRRVPSPLPDRAPLRDRGRRAWPAPRSPYHLAQLGGAMSCWLDRSDLTSGLHVSLRRGLVGHCAPR